MTSFNKIGLSPEILKGIEDLGFEYPMPIQEKVIPIFLKKHGDIIGLAQTGTGKTGAYGLPLLQLTDTSNREPQALILSPTRELCVQITRDLKNFSKYIKGMNVVAIYGGANVEQQIREVKKGAQIIVATPGRMVDLLKRRKVNISSIHSLVLDEADEMLNIGFREELGEILKKTPEEKNTLLFSATMSKDIAAIASSYMKDPIEIVIGKRNVGAQNVNFIYYLVNARDRYLVLKRIADINPDIYGIIFCRTRRETKDIAEKLIKDGYNADALHGDLSQSQRDYVMKRFRLKNLQMLVATDVAARGLDVNDLTHVINYNLPDEIESYTHRSGRTGRAGKTGTSIAIIHTKEKYKLRQIEKIVDQKFEQHSIPLGKDICEKQLLSLMDKMEKVKVNERQIKQFLPKVYEKLENLNREEIIKQFVSLEFNRFLEYYKDAPDLNVFEEKSKQREKKGKKSKDFVRFFINAGTMDGLTPAGLISLINKTTKNRDIKIGKLDLMKKFSFFEVNNQFADAIPPSFEKTTYKERALIVEKAQPLSPLKDTKNRKERKRKAKNKASKK